MKLTPEQFAVMEQRRSGEDLKFLMNALLSDGVVEVSAGKDEERDQAFVEAFGVNPTSERDTEAPAADEAEEREEAPADEPRPSAPTPVSTGVVDTESDKPAQK